MKKVLSITLIALLFGVVSSASPVAQAKSTSQSSISQSIKLPDLNNANTVKRMKNGKISLAALNGKKINFDSTYQDVENKLGKPLQRKILENRKYIDVQYAYNEKENYFPAQYNVLLESTTKHNINNYKKAKISKIKLTYDKKFTVNTVEKYFGKARHQFQLGNKNQMWKSYGERTLIQYKKVKGTWIVNEVEIESYLSPTAEELNKPVNE